MRKQLNTLRDVQGKPLRGGVMVIPSMQSIEEWDAQAVKEQQALTSAIRDHFVDIAPIVDVTALVPDDPMIEHERLYQAHRRSTGDGVREYFAHKRELARRVTEVVR